MATIYQLRTFLDIITAVMEQTKLQSTDTVSKNRIKRDLNTIYLNEVCPYEQWKWLRGYTQVTHDAVVTSGTAEATQNSVTVTLTVAPATSKKGFNLKIEGCNDIYRIFQHSAGSTTIVLETPYLGATQSAGSYKIWTDRLVMPTDLVETFEITQNFSNVPLEGVGIQEFRRLCAAAPFAEGKPQWYSTSDYVDPAAYASISGLPALSTSASAGLIKTLVFASDISSYLQEGDRIEIAGSRHYSYNGEFVVATVSTTTMTYTGKVHYSDSAAADSSLTVKKLSAEKNVERYREVYIYPSISNTRSTLNIDYIREAPALENDSDEPLMPLGDRTVLLYGTLMLTWARERNETQSARNAQLYDRKLMKMAGKVDDSTDLPQLIPGKTYLASKRFMTRGRDDRTRFFGSGGGASSGGATTGTANRAAIFNSSGLLEADSLISTTELEYLDGVASQVLGRTDTGTFTNKSIDADANTITNIENADIKALAAIAVSKLAAQTPSVIAVYDASGFLTSNGITATELTYLDDVEALTTFAMADNQAAAANVATWLHASFSSIQIGFSLSRGAGNQESGTIYVCTDGTSAGIAVSSASIGTLGVTFSADISGTSVRLRYVSTSTGTAPTMKYKVQKWLA